MPFPLLGPIIGAVSTLAGGAMAMRSARKNREATSIQSRVSDARAAGISPLAALGASPIYQQPYGIAGAEAVEKSGNQIGRALTAQMEAPQKRAVESLALQQAQSSLEHMNLQNDLLRAQIRQQNTPSFGSDSLSKQFGIVGQGPIKQPDINTSPDLGIQFKKNDVPISSKLGVQTGVKPFYGDFIDDSGDIWRMPSPEVAEILESSLPDSIRYILKQFGKSFVSNLAGLTPVTRDVYRQYLRKFAPSAPKGYEYVWNFGRQQWRLTKLKGKKLKLYEIKR